MNRYSIIIPIHNEVNSIPYLLNTLTDYNKKGHEIIIIDDGSTDGSTALLQKCKIIKLLKLKKNKGKGFAVKQGLNVSKFNKIIIFDGDMELKSSEISKLMILDKDKNKNFVMGYRFKSLSPLKSNFDWGNFMFTGFFNLLFNSKHKDILCCAKSFYLDSIKGYEINSIGFDIDVELASIFSIISKKGSISQVRLSYDRRGPEDGKKLRVSDGWIILSRIIKMTKYI